MYTTSNAVQKPMRAKKPFFNKYILFFRKIDFDKLHTVIFVLITKKMFLIVCYDVAKN